ncbi:PREDICTED: facilitated trehalose transporter Tret1-like [Nicrophorus vespilloides]|uniref:Facilitated trehalose transporter Tret1-like n=1 Tax=Nicrophorus vespilloides TaxID=110193 RepID=A0ABM1NF22_NICVS|nr:PREDICTED: facilitated trehalose transporter Tret1-like [Nicrophorus vespilloides]
MGFSRQSLPQVLAVTVKNILLVAFGLTLGFPTILIPGLSDQNEELHVDTDGVSWIGSINLISVPIGCLISGTISHTLGRKRAMQLVNLPFIGAWLIFRFATAPYQIFVALALTGLTGGFLEAPVLTYVAEIAQPNLRGMLSSTSTLAVISGVLTMFCLGTFFHWRTVAFICTFFNVVSFILLFFVPESPHWLISKNRNDEAKKSLAWLRGWTTMEAIENEYKEVYKEVKRKEFDGNMNGKEVPKRSKLETIKLFGKKNFFWPYSLISFIFFLHHFNGMTTLQTYSIQIFSSLHVPIDKYYATVMLGIVELCGCLFCVILVHYIGKRVLNFISLAGSCICFTAVATYAYMIDVNNLELPSNNATTGVGLEEVYHEYSWMPLVFLVLAAFVTHAGIRVLPWILTGEVFSNDIRAGASGLAGAIGYVFGFLSNKVFLRMISTLTLPGVFWFNASLSLLGLIFLYFFLPETEGKTLGQITEHFSGGKNMGNHVQRGRHRRQLEQQQQQQMQMSAVNAAYVSEIQT